MRVRNFSGNPTAIARIARMNRSDCFDRTAAESGSCVPAKITWHAL